jgi:NADPH:quinone reductase-like Zn-dependent oxidoreductase
MKAIVVYQYGGPEVLRFEDYPDPVPGPGEVLVRVAAASVNPIDYKRRAGLTAFPSATRCLPWRTILTQNFVS